MSSLAERHAIAQVAWGDDEPEPRSWSVGAWSLELRGDELAELTFDGRAVLRSVKVVVRDANWGTVPSQAVSVSARADSLDLELRFSGLGAEFSGTLRVDVDDDGGLRITTELRVLVPFASNRAGLIVLLPAATAGSPLRVGHPDGSEDRTELPARIAPHQPAFDIRSLEWEHVGLRTELEFAGEVFEMEDQRNWTDASFKVYSTPLALPFPVDLPAGTVITQSLGIRATSIAAAPAVSTGAAIALHPTGRTVPEIGTSASSGPDPIAVPADDPGVLLVELDLSAANWPTALARAVAEAGDGGLDIRLISDDPTLIADAVAAVAPHRPERLGVVSPATHITEQPGWDALVRAVAAVGVDADLVGGTRAHFTELNRTHERLPAGLPAIAFSSTPQMHAQERAQLVESIAAQHRTALDAVQIAAGRPVHVGPITLRPRFNAVATTPPPAEPADLAHGYGPAHLASATDARLGAPAAAAWLVAAAAAFAVPGVASLSFFEASGPRGMHDRPVAEAFSWLRELSGNPLLEPDTELPDGLAILAAETPTGRVALLTNLAAEPRRVSVDGADVGLPPLSAQRILLGS